jgi:hypothetical protein
MTAQQSSTDEGPVSRDSDNQSAEMRNDEAQAEADPGEPTTRERLRLSGVRRRTVVVAILVGDPGGHQRDVDLLVTGHGPEAGGDGQVRAAAAPAGRPHRHRLVRLVPPGQGRPRRARLLSRPPLPGPALRGRPGARLAVHRRRERGVPAVTGNDPLQSLQPGLQLADRRSLRPDHHVPLRAPHRQRRHRRHRHNQPSSPNRTAIKPTRSPQAHDLNVYNKLAPLFDQSFLDFRAILSSCISSCWESSSTNFSSAWFVRCLRVDGVSQSVSALARAGCPRDRSASLALSALCINEVSTVSGLLTENLSGPRALLPLNQRVMYA